MKKVAEIYTQETVEMFGENFKVGVSFRAL